MATSSAEWKRADVREVKHSGVKGKRKSEGESIASRLVEPRDRTQETRRRQRSRLEIKLKVARSK